MNKILFPFLLSIFFLSCQEESKIEPESFPYMVTATSPTEYPTEVHIGYLADDKKKLICGIPKTGMLQAGWNGDGAAGAMGSDIVPSHINLIYVAYAEKKFYQLDADLPKEKIEEAFRKGFLVQGNTRIAKGVYNLEHSTYSTFTIAIAPGGVVVIFLGGGDRIEICRLQAKETFVDKNEFIPHPDPSETQQQFFDIGFKYAVPDSIQTQIMQNGIPYDLYEQYRKKYKYRFIFKPYDEKDVIRMELDRYYNGEVTDFLQPEEIAKKEYKNQGIPYNIEFIFTKYNTEIVFNDQEMLSVFDELQQKHPGKLMDILVVPTFMYKDFKLSVKCEDEVIPLKKYIVKGVWGG